MGKKFVCGGLPPYEEVKKEAQRNTWGEKLFILIGRDQEAADAYRRLTEGNPAALSHEVLVSALAPFFLNSTRKDWAFPSGISRRRLRELPRQLKKTALDLRRLDSHAFFSQSLPDALETAHRLENLAQALARRVAQVFRLRKGLFRRSEFYFKLKAVVPSLASFARHSTGKPHFEDLACIFGRVAEIAAGDAEVGPDGKPCELPERDVVITAETLRGMCRDTPGRLNRSRRDKKLSRSRRDR